MKAQDQGSFSEWIKQGARAQGAWGWGIVLVGGGLCAALISWIDGLRSAPLYAICALVTLVGAPISREAFRRERKWRRDNPFHGSRPGATKVSGGRAES